MKGERCADRRARRNSSLMLLLRYSVMDYIFWASTFTANVARIMASYDIGCQWKIHLEERRAGMPTMFRRDDLALQREIEVSLPVWHAGVHQEDCEMCESLRYKTGAGMTDGEGVERIWAATNPKAYATKEMHIDTRHAALEDHFNNHNWQMNLRLRTSTAPRRATVTDLLQRLYCLNG